MFIVYMICGLTYIATAPAVLWRARRVEVLVVGQVAAIGALLAELAMGKWWYALLWVAIAAAEAFNLLCALARRRRRDREEADRMAEYWAEHFDRESA